MAWLKTASRSVAADGVTVNGALPGRHSTARIEQLDRIAAERRRVDRVEEIRAAHVAAIPAGATATADEFASLRRLPVLRAGARYQTGTFTAVDGGSSGPALASALLRRGSGSVSRRRASPTGSRTDELAGAPASRRCRPVDDAPPAGPARASPATPRGPPTPSATARTVPPDSLATQPPIPDRPGRPRRRSIRKPTPWTTPWTEASRRTPTHRCAGQAAQAIASASRTSSGLTLPSSRSAAMSRRREVRRRIADRGQPAAALEVLQEVRVAHRARLADR